MYPLGSCTMKYNPKVNEDLAGLPGFARTHPETDVRFCQGAIALLYHLSQAPRRDRGHGRGEPRARGGRGR